MANNISVTISRDCEAITVKMIAMSGTSHSLLCKRNGATLALSPNTFPNPVAGQIITLTFTASQLQATTVNNQTGTAAELTGVYMFTATDGTTTATGGVVAACNLDCCIANEINDFISCPCDPTESPKLEKATKVLLLREGAEADMSASIQNPDNALTKYNKALEICNSSCGCGC